MADLPRLYVAGHLGLAEGRWSEHPLAGGAPVRSP